MDTDFCDGLLWQLRILSYSMRYEVAVVIRLGQLWRGWGSGGSLVGVKSMYCHIYVHVKMKRDMRHPLVWLH